MTLGRRFTDTFTGIDPANAPAFVAARLVGAALAVAAVRFLFPDITEVSDQVVAPHDG